MKLTTVLIVAGVGLIAVAALRAGYEANIRVSFDKRLQPWDGFGVNYVEAAQTRNYAADPQEYGGFSTLSEEKRREILELTFGPDGLKPGMLKMFLDPWHQAEPGAAFDHKKTTAWMRYLAREGLRRNRFYRWPTDGSWGGYARHDYNMYWHNTQVVEVMKLLRPVLDRHGLKDVGIAPGETSSWDRFINWGYAYGIWQDDAAFRSLGLITSHGFRSGQAITSRGFDLLRQKRPELHAWTTSMSWGQMDVKFVEGIRQQIYEVKVNGIIPWATVQTDTWVGGDPNPGTAFRVDRKGGYSVEPGYYYFKQVSRSGQPGMAVVEIQTATPEIQEIAFSSNGTNNADALVVFNVGASRKDLIIEVRGAGSNRFDAFRTGPKACHAPAGEYTLRNGALEVTLYPDSVMTFFAKAK